MTCASCVSLIESTLLKRNGILQASVSLAALKAHVLYQPDKIGPRDIMDVVIGLGYEVEVQNSKNAQDHVSHKSDIAK
jgi:Cu+-exporting ATPase